MSEDQVDVSAVRVRRQRDDAKLWLGCHDYPITDPNIEAAIAVHLCMTVDDDLVWLSHPRVVAAFTLGVDAGLVARAALDAGGPDLRPGV
jgi:hypothetical protein